VEEKAERKSEFDPSGNSAWMDHIPIRVVCNRSAEKFLVHVGPTAPSALSVICPTTLREMHGWTSRRLRSLSRLPELLHLRDFSLGCDSKD
jgi:hypothetical protein